MAHFVEKLLLKNFPEKCDLSDFTAGKFEIEKSKGVILVFSVAFLFVFTGGLALIPCSNVTFFWISLGVVMFLTLTVTVLNMTLTVEAMDLNCSRLI